MMGEENNMITYQTDLKGISSDHLKNFFVGWPDPPSKETFLKLLQGSYKIVLALEDDKVIGFINAISDGILSAYIPLLEVLPEYQKQGIGKTLVSKIIAELKNLYMIDLLCDEDLISYYEKIGMNKAQGVCVRNYDRQSGVQ